MTLDLFAFVNALTIPTVPVLAYMVASREADADAWQTRKNIKDGVTKKLDHPNLLIMRCIYLAAGIGIMIALVSLKLMNPWMIIPHAASAWAAFTMRHRFYFNELMLKDRRYMAPDTNYDWFWLVRSGIDLKRSEAKVKHNYWFSHTDWYPTALYKAGLWAYRFEGTVATLSIITATLLAWLLN